MTDLWPWLPVVLLVLLLVFLWRRAATRTSRANRARQRVAGRGEEHAELLLERAGYTIDDRQVTAHWTMWVDGAPQEVRCRADLIVSRRRRCYVAEVKTGDRAPDPTLPATRRQLLEYERAFDVDGLLLVDIPGERIREVAFR